MIPRVKELIITADDLNWVPGIHGVEEESQLSQVVF